MACGNLFNEYKASEVQRRILFYVLKEEFNILGKIKFHELLGGQSKNYREIWGEKNMLFHSRLSCLSNMSSKHFPNSISM